MDELGGKGGVLVSSKNNCEQNIRILANSFLEMQKYESISPHTIKLLEEIAKG